MGGKRNGLKCNEKERKDGRGTVTVRDGLCTISQPDRELCLSSNTDKDPDNILNLFNNVFHNLSDTQFTIEERVVLALGLKFKRAIAPPDNGTIKDHFDSYANKLRQLKIKAYCGINTDNTHPILHKVNSYIFSTHYKCNVPEQVTSAIADTFGIPLEQYLATAEKKLHRLLGRCRAKRNFQLERDRAVVDKGIKALKARHGVIIKPTDKNLEITTVKRSEYIQAGYKKLNSSNYQKMQECNLESIAQELIEIFKGLNYLTYTQADDEISFSLPLQWSQFSINPKYEKLVKAACFYLYNPEFIQLCRFYLIAKVHKTPMGWREICASPGWVTSIVAMIIHHILLPILQDTPNYVRQSKDVIVEMETKFFPEDCVFIQADVESMYPSIDITNGLQALQKTLEERRTPHDKTTAILQLTAWVLKNNFMVFNQDTYKQLNGTAMGSPLSVTYACLYIAYKEQLAIRQLLYRGLPDPIIYRRMVDDIAAVVRDMNSALTLMKLLETNVDKGIKFEYQISKDKLIFMDLEIFKTDVLKQRGKLDTTLYQKPMNKYLFLPFQSAHPLSVFKAWITCYIQRIRVLCSIDEMFETHKKVPQQTKRLPN